MSRRLSWSVAIGATFLFALTGCANQGGFTSGTALPASTAVATASASPGSSEAPSSGSGDTASGDSTDSATPDGSGGSTQQSESTVTVTDVKDRTVDLKSSSLRVLGGDSLTLDSGQTIPLKSISKIDVTHPSTGTALAITLTNGQQVNGPFGSYTEVSGDADAGPYALVMLYIKTIEVRSDTPFVSTPLPQLAPWTAATATVTDKNGKKSVVSAESLRLVGGDSITLDTGQQVSMQNIERVDTTHPTTGTAFSITLVTGKKVSGGIGDYSELTGDATTGEALSVLTKDLTSIEIQRGGGS